jgi:hypothetical protein
MITVTERKRDGHLIVTSRARGDHAEHMAEDECQGLIDTQIGEVYMIARREYVGPSNFLTRNGEERIVVEPDNGEGWGGNMNPALTRYHGWRGTTNDWATHGEGVRRLLHRKTRRYRNSALVRFEFGPDLKPDED